MVDAGVLEGVDVVIGLHSDPTREWGRVGLTSGTFSAYANGFVIEVDGLASHGGMSPEKGLDAIMAGSYVVPQRGTPRCLDYQRGHLCRRQRSEPDR